MWSADSGTCMRVFSGHMGSVTCGKFTADGKLLITTSEQGELIVWSPKTGDAVVHVKRKC
jgi:WD40 repeat protein